METRLSHLKLEQGGLLTLVEDAEGSISRSRRLREATRVGTCVPLETEELRNLFLACSPDGW